MDDLRQQRSVEALEMERIKRQLNKSALQISELQKTLSETERALRDAEAHSAQENVRRGELLGTQQDLQTEVQTLRHSREKADKEKATLQHKLDNQRKICDDLTAQIESLQHEAAALRSERDMYKRDLIMQETQRAELHFQEFRQDMERTVNEYKDAERDRKQKDEVVRGLQMDLSRERERASLFKTQINLLEERLRVATKELASYRSLDVYHNSLKGELELYRAVKNSQLTSTAMSATSSPAYSPPSSSQSYTHTHQAQTPSTATVRANSPTSGGALGRGNGPSTVVGETPASASAVRYRPPLTRGSPLFDVNTSVNGENGQNGAVADTSPNYNDSRSISQRQRGTRYDNVQSSMESDQPMTMAEVDLHVQSSTAAMTSSLSETNDLSRSQQQLTTEELRQRRLEREKAREMSMRKELSREMSTKRSQSASSSSSAAGLGHDTSAIYAAARSSASAVTGHSTFKVGSSSNGNALSSSLSLSAGTGTSLRLNGPKTDFERARRLLRMSEN